MEDRPAVAYAAIKRDDITAATFGRIADRVPVILGWLGERGLAPAGAPFLKYNVIGPGDVFEVEAGVPVASPVRSEGEVFGATLPAGRYAGVSFVGHPLRLVDVTASVVAWGARQGLAWDMREDGGAQRWACRLEIFRTHPLEVPDPNEWVTDVALKLR